MPLLSSEKLALALALLLLYSLWPVTAGAQRRSAGARAVVVDERLAALRDEPSLNARLLQRMSRGRMVSILAQKRSAEGVLFYRVAVTRRTRGWIQSEALVVPNRAGEDERLLRLLRASEDFDRIIRARIFLDIFPKSSLRPNVLMLYGEAAEEAAAKLSREATRRLQEKEMTAGGAPLFSYFMNYAGLDRYNRQGITFIFDRQNKRFHYDGESWREIVRRYPQSPEAEGARKRLDSLATAMVR